jgi:chromosome segregation ATPase
MHSHEGSLSASLHQMEVEFREAQKRIDDLTREFEKTEAKLVETQIKYNKMKADRNQVEKELHKNRKELKKLA